MRCLVTVSFLLIAGAAGAVAPDAITGTWATEDEDGNKDSIVEIRRAAETYEGVVVWMKFEIYPPDDPKGWVGKTVVDRENPDPALRERPIMGLRTLHGLRFDDGEWVGGEIYAPRQGKTYRAKAWLEDPDTLKIRGYIGTPWLGRNVTWRRAEPPAE